jgi:small-conductance mechanosensitive channel
MKKQNEILYEKTTQFKAALDQAITTKMNNVETMRRLYQQTYSAAQEQKQDLLNLERHHKQAAEQVKKNLDKENRDLENLQRNLDELKKKERSYVDKLEMTKREVRRAEQQLESKRIEYEDEKKLKSLHLSEATKAITLYRENLGLEFERVCEDKLRFIFTLIDPKDVAREFWFTVFIDAAKHFHIEECQPPLDGLTEVEAELNRDSDFTAFIRKMRRKFKEKV